MKKFSIGVPKERKTKEGRVGMTPDGVRQILREGEQNGEGPLVYSEQGAGVLAGFSDESYLDA
jgi:alanine dehydrogenase